MICSVSVLDNCKQDILEFWTVGLTKTFEEVTLHSGKLNLSLFLEFYRLFIQKIRLINTANCLFKFYSKPRVPIRLSGCFFGDEYRPITLNPEAKKVFERLILSHFKSITDPDDGPHAVCVPD